MIEAEISWGTKKLNESAFYSGSASIRASMTANLIRSEKFIGKSCVTISEILGEKTGDYYVSDGNVTYALTEKKSANWILTFICGESGRVERVIIRKSCCSASQSLVRFGINFFGSLLFESRKN